MKFVSALALIMLSASAFASAPKVDIFGTKSGIEAFQRIASNCTVNIDGRIVNFRDYEINGTILNLTTDSKDADGMFVKLSLIFAATTKEGSIYRYSQLKSLYFTEGSVNPGGSGSSSDKLNLDPDLLVLALKGRTVEMTAEGYTGINNPRSKATLTCNVTEWVTISN